MKPLIFLCAFLSGLLLLVSCRKQEEEPLIPGAQEYQSWDQPVAEILDYPIPGHENNRRRIFINAAGTEVRVDRRENRAYWEYPEGTGL